MALIKCPECNKDVSSTVKQCIHCGYVFENKEESKAQVQPQPKPESQQKKHESSNDNAKKQKKSNEPQDTCQKIYKKWTTTDGLAINTFLDCTYILFIPVIITLIVAWARGMMDVISFGIIFVGISCFDILYCILSYVWYIKFGAWIKDKKPNVLETIDKDLIFQPPYSTIKEVANAVYIQSTLGSRKPAIVKIVLACTTNVIRNLLFVAYLSISTNGTWLLYSDDSLIRIIYAILHLLPALIFALPSLITKKLSQLKHNLLIQSFIKKHCPKGYNLRKYRHESKNWVEYI